MDASPKVDCIVAVFARAPVAGAAKTRLIPRLGPEGACALHRQLVDRTLAMALASGVGPVELWCAPDATHPYFHRQSRTLELRLSTQREGDIGQRMHHAAQDVLQRSRALILIGTDCPAMTTQDLRDADAALREGDDAVFLPVEDGGYTLVALSRPQPTLFSGIEWSTPRVMPQTRERLRTAQLRWRELPTRWDLDRPEDLDRWQAAALTP